VSIIPTLLSLSIDPLKNPAFLRREAISATGEVWTEALPGVSLSQGANSTAHPKPIVVGTAVRIIPVAERHTAVVVSVVPGTAT
jgi:hypothetical protein